MIIKPELVKKIKDHFNLNIYETRVWLALLAKGVASAGEIAELSEVPRSRTYDVLESLEKSGFAISKLGKPAKYIAVKPTVILEKMKNQTLKKAQVKVATLEKLKETAEYNELKSLYENGISPVKHKDLSGSIKGKSTIYNHIKEILESAKSEAIICTTAKEVLEKQRFFSSMIDTLNKRKINIKIALSGTDQDIKKINSKLKIKVKKVNLSAKFFLIDKEQVLFILSETGMAEEQVAIWLNSEFFTNALAYLFDQIYK
jgi:HTH-type transcriptional regulator, sugar sensing transcriptional regulator